MSKKKHRCPNGQPMEDLTQKPLRGSDVRLITAEELRKLLGISRSTLDRAIRSDPAFPQPRRLSSGRLIRFVHAEVLDYISGLPCAEYSDHAFDPNSFSD
ncbi:helix-turn-helix transcriptional regulator [Roseicyclus marinus]|jgi:predicted DNA-binding transcriptional regulator AlpA|uniref:helix-turn-helix transcriptional regulator n=1 Tax=Roseicyclus marinus TaxID=2161673 RepID=UPI0024107C07|nr:AlpA family phage regulatory protein [Roseicyclus marinus]MDG3039793.1 AlpA family phage regulatory protein [Roseicyclus marinus]